MGVRHFKDEEKHLVSIGGGLMIWQIRITKATKVRLGSYTSRDDVLAVEGLCYQRHI